MYRLRILAGIFVGYTFFAITAHILKFNLNEWTAILASIPFMVSVMILFKVWED